VFLRQLTRKLLLHTFARLCRMDANSDAFLRVSVLLRPTCPTPTSNVRYVRSPLPTGSDCLDKNIAPPDSIRTHNPGNLRLAGKGSAHESPVTDITENYIQLQSSCSQPVA
jgi:hypothetical protein